jgi:hypothetical protein
MMALARYIVSGRWQAVLVTSASGVLGILLLPFSCVGAASVSLVTLHVGIVSGLQVMVLATAGALLLYLLAGVKAAFLISMVLLLWLPCWLISGVLQQTRDLGYALKVASLFGACMLVLVYVLLGNPVQVWVEILSRFAALFEESGLVLQGLSDEQLMRDVAGLMTGVVLAWLVLSIIASLLLGRWWQSIVVHPGGFREEFCSLRLGYVAGLLTLGVMLLAQLTEGASSEFAAQLAMILLVPYLLTGLAIIHSLVNQAGLGKGWLVVIYVLLGLVPQSMLLLAGGGLLDTWIDFRRRLARGGNG